MGSDTPSNSPQPSSAQPAFTAAQQRNGAIALVAATFFWGSGFTWAKMGGETVHHVLGLPNGSPFGPIFLLAWRFLCASIIWLVLFRSARKGWTWRGVARGLLLGFLVGVGLVVQHLGLDRTSEAVSAFLTSLTILFVPLLMTIVLRKPPPLELWAGVALATVGVWLMTGATPHGFGLGEVLGLLCSFTFSLYILAVNAILPHESPWRMTAAQFVVVSLMCFIACALIHPRFLRPPVMVHVLSASKVWINMLLLAVFTTDLSFGLLTHFQPRLDATRAALIYLLEPIVAAGYAAVAVHHELSKSAILGAALILLANIAVELISARKRQMEKPMLID